MQTALVLQGGGALGAYEFGAIKRLYEQPHFAPQIISGVSIGAINAAVLVGSRGDPIRTLETLWERLTVMSPPFMPQEGQQFLSLFGNPDFFHMRYDYVTAMSWTSFYDTDPLPRLLDELIDFDRIAASPTRLLITATDVETGTLTVFDNHAGIGAKPITAEHILASGSLPPGFPMAQIDGRSYWDGGLFNNTPLAPVIDRLDPAPGEEKQIFIVNTFPGAGEVPRNMMGVLDRIFEIIFSNKLRFDIETLRKVNEFVETVNAIDRQLPRNSPIRQLPGFKRLNQYKLIRNLVTIENRRDELVFGPFDFSKNSIRSRIKAGYRDAAEALNDLGAAQPPAQAARPTGRKAARAEARKPIRVASRPQARRARRALAIVG
jgi:NTE family protein